MSHPTEKAKAIVGSFLRDRGQEIEELHDAFSMKMPRPKMSSRVRSESKGPQSNWDEDDDFMDELRKFNRCLDEVSRQVPLDFDPKDCQWSDVLRKLKDGNESLARRMERDETWWSKGGMWLADLSTLSPALQAIPDDLCFLHGGLALVLHLAKTRDSTKRNIVNTFEDVTTALARAGNAAEHSKDDPQLNNALDTLRVTLFKTLPPLIRILVPEKLRMKFSAPFQSTRAERLLDFLKTDAKRVEARARTLNDQHASEAAMITKEHVEDIHSGVQDLNEQVHELDASQQAIKNIVLRALEGQDNMYKMLCDFVGLMEYDHSQKGPTSAPAFSTRARSPSPTSPENALVTENKLATLQMILGVDDKHVSKDINYVRRQSHEFDAKCKSTTAVILLNRNFQRWTRNHCPDFVYFDGRPERTYDKTSPISYFCAQLAYRSKGGPHTTTTLCFFCGQHVAFNDPLAGPRGLMRSLISQALRARPTFELEELDLTAFDGTHESIQFEDLCYLFRLIIGQFPPGYTVFCIIDDINRLEKDQWSREYWAVIDMLDEMVGESGPNLCFKVLITSPARSKWLNGISQDRRVLVQEGGLQ
ncbi:hypothetical protein B0T16DRAFT_400627 [Cercophora newfieldiana]|uniref:Nephrocystin 3-like N-terminal domain-containing protein n=1 Tax=Cercophora newfieldiana TaxID=92897 RepID=A0AA39YQU7_9PEZI|nr:hypothetical protein B0T16DRAFT_400627 [Cercophora newfieldiana]